MLADQREGTLRVLILKGKGFEPCPEIAAQLVYRNSFVFSGEIFKTPQGSSQ